MQMIVGKSEEFNSQGIKWNRAFRGCFFCPRKKQQKADRLCMKFYSNPNRSIQRCLISFQRLLFLLPTLFWGYLKPQIKLETSIVSIITLLLQDYPQGYILSYFYKLLRALSFSRMLAEFSLQPLYSTVGKKFKI